MFKKRPEGQLAVVPRHVAIIMDGNGRWARRRGLPRSMGHRAGYDRIEEVMQACADAGVEYLTLYAFSTENWRRDENEVNYLMGLFAEALNDRTPRLEAQGIRLRFIGRRDRLPADLLDAMKQGEMRTAHNTRFHLVLAIDYGARDELVEAARRLAEKVRRGCMGSEEISAESFAAELMTSELPEPDLIIRTSGERRLSNFLLWQGAYAELYFTKLFWPDFGRAAVLEALADYAARDRRYGGVK